jgi:rhamnopyranosyl-N-acetylglucosaminyl-diphospho-decaprenol beta-1,3/1,4-galactofuranosyltransferase
MILAAIVVTYNRLEELKITLARLLTEDVDHIVVADNASSDGTHDWLTAQTDPRLHVITLSDNRGGAGGFEAGMAAARDQFDPDWVVLMDDDARPYQGALAMFRNETSKLEPKTGAVAAAVFYPNGTLCEMNRPSRNPFWNLGLFAKTLFTGSRSGFHLENAAFAPDAGPHPIDVASFVGYFVHRDTVAQAGLPEGGLFIYGDDVLYSLRLRRAGFGMTLMPAIRFEHDCGTMGEGFIYRPLWKIYYHCRNGVSIARQAAGPIVFPLAILYYTVIWWCRGRYYKDEERALYRYMMWKGLRDGLLRKRGRNDAIHRAASSTV